MSNSSEDIERNQEEDTNTTLFSLRDVFIFSDSLFAFAIVLVLLGACASASLDYLSPFSSQSTLNSFIGSDMFILQHKGKAYAFNPTVSADSKLKSAYLFKIMDFPSLSNAQLSKDKKRLYIFGRGSLEFNFNTRKVAPVKHFPGYHAFDIILRKPDLNTVLYGHLNRIDLSGFIRHYSIEESRVIEDYPTKCLTGTPDIVGQSLDGSKLLYRCATAYEYFLKNLEDSNSEDQID